MSEDSYYRKSCIIFFNPDGDMVPGVAVFTDGIEDINEARKRSVHFEIDDQNLTIKEMGTNYYGHINKAKSYLQLSEKHSEELQINGKVTIPRDCYTIIKQDKPKH